MASQGPFTAGTVASPTTSGATGAWSNAGGATGTGSSPYATWTNSTDSVYSPFLVFTGWNGSAFAIPAGSTINGIVAQLTNLASHSSSNTNIVDYEVYLLVNNSFAGTNKANTSAKWPTSSQTVTYGSSTDLWGSFPTVAQVNDSANFGLMVSAFASVASGSLTATIVSCLMTIYYTPPAGGNVPMPLVSPGALGALGGPFGIANPARRSRVEAVRFKQG